MTNSRTARQDTTHPIKQALDTCLLAYTQWLAQPDSIERTRRVNVLEEVQPRLIALLRLHEREKELFDLHGEQRSGVHLLLNEIREKTAGYKGITGGWTSSSEGGDTPQDWKMEQYRSIEQLLSTCYDALESMRRFTVCLLADTQGYPFVLDVGQQMALTRVLAERHRSPVSLEIVSPNRFFLAGKGPELSDLHIDALLDSLSWDAGLWRKKQIVLVPPRDVFLAVLLMRDLGQRTDNQVTLLLPEPAVANLLRGGKMADEEMLIDTVVLQGRGNSPENTIPL